MMTTTDSGSDSDIPAFAVPLSPYIKTRQEALLIRQALTLYLRSHITFTSDDNGNGNGNDDNNNVSSNSLLRHDLSHLSLCAPHDAVIDVKRIPPELTGLRKEYLDALQANLTAKRNYQSLSSQNATAARIRFGYRGGNFPPSSSSSGTVSAADDANARLETYLALIRDRRRQAKLQVFRHYLQQLRDRDAARLEYFESRENRNEHASLPIEFDRDGDGVQNAPGTETEDGGVEGLVYKLEKAVLRAKSHLDREKRLFEELRGKQKSNVGQELPSATKVKALQRTRDELVQWVEEKLITVSGSDEGGPLREIPAEEVEESTHILEERKEQIRSQYASYVEARRNLLDAISGACQPVAPVSTMPQSQSHSRNAKNNDKDDTLSEQTTSSPLDSLNILSFTTKTLHPLSKSQKALALQKSYLSALLAKEKSTAIRTLNRLSDESHLLPEYPILARQSRFKHAVAAINTRSAHDPARQQTDEITSLAEAWAFASNAARENEKEFVEQKAMLGAEIAQDEQLMLKEVYGMLNQDLDEVVRGGREGGDDDDDIWSYEVRSGSLRGRQGRNRGPWSGLNGRIGVAEGV